MRHRPRPPIGCPQDVWTVEATMQRLAVHPVNPQPRHIARAAQALRAGGLIVYPTDTTYGMGCDLYAKRAIERIYAIKAKPKNQPLSFLCADLSELARYGKVDNPTYRILRQRLSGQYTFILNATKEVPRALTSSTGTVGLRISDSAVCIALIKEMGHPLVSTTVTRAPEDPSSWLGDPDDIEQALTHSVEVFLDMGILTGGPSTVVDLTTDVPTLVRAGAGDTSWFD